MPVTIGGSGPITGVTSINTTVSDTELGYLDGVSSALQTQINAKANDSSQGLYLITPTSIANSGGSASASGGAVTFSGVTSVSLNGVFTSTYDNYHIVIRASGSTSATQLMRLRVSGTDVTASDYRYYGAFGGITSGNISSGAQTSWNINGIGSSSEVWVNAVTLFNPFISGRTDGTVLGQSQEGYARYLGLGQNGTNAADGFSLIANAGNITGTVRVYGYKN